MKTKLSRRGRWAVPGAAVVVAAGVIAGLQIPAAQAAPDLPAQTPAQLLALVGSEHTVPPMTGTVVETASLGLPQLPQTGNQSSLTSLLTGSHTVKVYYQDASHFRLALPQPQAETDLIANGSKLWLWQSASDSVTQFTGPAEKTEKQVPAAAALTPQQAASAVLAAVGATTVVSVQANVMVAGEPAYQLVLAPKDSRSLVGRVVIAIDGKHGVPLRLQLFAKGAGSPAFQVGYTDVQFVTPSAANFSFTPPAGASVDRVNLASEAGKPQPAATKPAGTKPAGVGTYGSSWLTVAAFPQADLAKGFSGSGKSDAYSAGGQGVGVSPQELLSALLASAKPVSGSWGSGSLVSTSLVSMLITKGEVYIGAVQPSVLYAAVGHIS